MKELKKHPMSLKKVVIAKIDSKAMGKIKGGDCIPTQHINSYIECHGTARPF